MVRHPEHNNPTVLVACRLKFSRSCPGYMDCMMCLNTSLNLGALNGLIYFVVSNNQSPLVSPKTYL